MEKVKLLTNITKSNDPRRIDLPGRILVAHQAEFLPWLGNISKATMGDVYLIFDNAQYVKKHWQNKNKIRIKGGDGWQWLTVPVKNIQNHLLRTDRVEIADDKWRQQHLKSIKLAYSRAAHFDEYYPEIYEIYNREYVFLIDFLLSLIGYAFDKFDIEIPLYTVSQLQKSGFTISGKKSQLVVSMCQAVGADVFIFGRDGRNYIEKELLIKNNIKYVFQKFEHPSYSQIQGEFISHMCFLDLLLNHGKKKSIEILGKSNYEEE